ncbi:MAG TPA: glucose-6-phosphate dehydrogenase assembly protein OpcA [Candidatus Limnocylindria bacterium]|nr:glucose-6-phosphate dehydrogenase assembly protein OpcA [Candidatus Limnocylindria bacterium]
MIGVDEAFWGARATSIDALERELARLRRAALAHAKERGHTLARASVLNLVVYAEREVHARRAARTVADLALRHPSRAIVVLGDRGREGVLASVQLHCHVPPSDGGKPVLYEQILARVRGDFDERVASVVIPLLVPDLPVFLWWTGTPPSDARHVDDLVTLADRLIVDSADFARADLTLPEVARLSRLRVGITDLNWARLTHWRELVAQFFDVPAWRPFLGGITGIRAGFAVDMDGRDIHPSQALLLLGWIASRLGWRPVEALAPSEAGGLLFKMARADNAPVMVRLRPRFERGLDTGDVSGVRIQAAVGRNTAEFVIKRAPDERHATATAIIDGVVRAERVVPLPALGIRELLGEELAIAGNDHVYEAALAAIMALA